MKVIIDRLEGEYYIGRTEFDSPEVDPEVLIERGDKTLHIGNFYHVEIINSDDFRPFWANNLKNFPYLLAYVKKIC